MEGAFPDPPCFIGPGLSPWPSDSSSISLICGRAGLYPKPVTGWAGSGRARGPGPRAKVRAGLALIGSEPPTLPGQWGDLTARPGSRLWDGLEEGLLLCLTLYPCLPPSLPPLPWDQEPSPTWREQRRLSSASASGQWSPTSEWVRVGAGGTPVGAGAGALGQASAQESLGGNVSKSQDWPGSQARDQSSWPADRGLPLTRVELQLPTALIFLMNHPPRLLPWIAHPCLSWGHTHGACVGGINTPA